MRNGCLIGCGTVFLLVALPVAWPLLSLAIPRNYGKMAREGRPLLEAIYRYKAEQGLWPLDMDSLVPDYLSHVPENWRYEWIYFGSFSLHRPTGAVREVLHYRVDCNGRGVWTVSGEGPARDVSGPLAVVPPTPFSKDELRRRTLAEFDRRIALRPKEKIHRQGKVSYLRNEALLVQASAACDELMEHSPNDSWLRLARACVKAERGLPGEAGGELRHWVATNPSFIAYCCLCYFYADQKNPELALAALEKACTFGSPSWSGCDQWPFGKRVHEWVLFALSTYAYEHDRHDMVLSLCGRWEQLRKDRGYAEESYMAMRTASLLAQGDLEGARASMQLIDDPAGMWMPDVDPLKQAAIRGDTGYVVDFGDCRPDLSLFVDYQ